MTTISAAKRIGIVGGMGPAAGTYFVQKLTELVAATCDQDHPVLLHISNSQIPDRTAYLLGEGADPVPEIARTIKDLEELNADVVCLPCNTAHAPVLFARYSAAARTPVINMVEETIDEITRVYPHIKRVGLLGTTGTLIARSYHDAVQDSQIELVSPGAKEQAALMDLIYAIKARGQKPGDAQKLYDIARTVPAELYILGCTELSMLSSQLYAIIDKPAIDSLEVLAHRALRYVQYSTAAISGWPAPKTLGAA